MSGHWSRTLRWSLALVVLALLLAGCGARAAPASVVLPATPAPSSATYQRTAEASYLPFLPPDLAVMVKAQAWYQELTKPGLDLIANLVQVAKDARARGAEASIPAMLQFASEQGWYQDGLDEDETYGLKAVFDAYARSLNDRNAPPIGSVLSTTLSGKLFDVVQLPESGRMVVLVSARNPEAGRKALAIANAALPRVESIVGAFPYKFLHIEITPDLPDAILGLSYNEFIEIRSDSVNEQVINHEITHSTLYGIFPTWFEEGAAHFIQYYLTNALEQGVRVYNNDLQQLQRGTKLDIRATRSRSELDQYVERAQGYLFLKGLNDVEGIDGVKATIRALRTQTRGDQDLLNAIAQKAPPDKAQAVARFICNQVVGATHDYCSAQ